VVEFRELCYSFQYLRNSKKIHLVLLPCCSLHKNALPFSSHSRLSLSFIPQYAKTGGEILLVTTLKYAEENSSYLPFPKAAKIAHEESLNNGGRQSRIGSKCKPGGHVPNHTGVAVLIAVVNTTLEIVLQLRSKAGQPQAVDLSTTKVNYFHVAGEDATSFAWPSPTVQTLRRRASGSSKGARRVTYASSLSPQFYALKRRRIWGR